MNTAISEISLYQLTQELEPPLTPIAIGAETVKSYVESIIDLAIEEQLQATIWVKLPQTKSWLNEIQRYQQQGNAERIYLCSTQKNHPAASFLQGNTTTPVVPIKLAKNYWLHRESFLIISAPNFRAVILAQWQKGQVRIESSGKRLQQPYLQMISSFKSPVINKVLAEIYNIVAIIPQPQSVSGSDFTIAAANPEPSDLFANLLLRQIQRTESVQTAFESLSRADRLPETTSTILGLQEDFLNNLVQELRSPITHMKTALSLLESKQIKGEQRQRYLQMVSAQCDRQNSLVSGLLRLLQLDSPTEIEYIRLDDFVPGIVSTYQPLAEENNIQLGYTIPSGLPPVSCPCAWLRQIIVNLLNNSLQFTPPKGKMFVQAALGDEYVELTVSDTGVGIETKELNKIFDGFYRTKPTNNNSTGAGLGLTLVQQLVKRCGGSISVSSKVGKGTSFKILLPIVPAELI